MNLPEGLRQQEILHAFKRLVPTYSPSPTGLGKYLTKAIPAIESQIQAPTDIPKIIVLRPSLPLARIQS
jgi:hypothetical protein